VSGVEEQARELLAAEYDRAHPGSDMAALVRSNAKLDERGIHAACIRAIEAALNLANRPSEASSGEGDHE
jgi:hypothetical protein